MTHQWHDTYRHHKTPAHHLDPRSKLFVTLFFVALVLCTPRFTSIRALGYPLIIVVAASLAGISLRPLLARLVTVLPFVGLMIFSLWLSHGSLARLEDVLWKALLSIAAMTLLALTTPFPDLIRALQELRLPKLFILFLAFLYRYGAVLYQEAVQLERAWLARYYGRQWLRQWQHLGHVVAALFIRSYERAERIFAAMQARGFTRETAAPSLLHFGMWDFVFVLIASSALCAVRWWPS